MVLAMVAVQLVRQRLPNFDRALPHSRLFGAAVGLLTGLATMIATKGAASRVSGPQASLPDVTNAETIGRVLYTDYVYFFQAAGLVLLVAMIGAIVLTLRHKPGVRRQDVSAQTARNPKSGMRMVDIQPGAGEGE
jgi:NADH-quinone oxidoreductase subunit J